MNEKYILLIEDNPGDIELTRRALRKGKILNELVVVEDGQEALDFLFNTGKFAADLPRPLPTLTLLDLKLPLIDGLEVLASIRAAERTRRMPVVVLTSSVEETDLATSYDLGVNSYIRKPVDFTQFANAIQTLGLYWLVMNQQPVEEVE
ncbi:MAG: response regulator [Anaerolineaceae bacterium]